MSAERLQKLLSAAGVASRRAAERLIVEGRVSVNGRRVTELGTRADPSTDDIRVDDRRIRLPQRHRYILLNKPPGYITSQRRPTVFDLLGGVRDAVYPVGRLDYDSEGLLLLTNDGDLAAALTHPRHEVTKLYEVRVQGVPDDVAIARLRKGVMLDGRPSAPADVRIKRAYTGRGRERAVLEIGIREGRNRQVRRMCEAVGHRVEALARVRIGPLRDPRLKPGMWRDLTRPEVVALQEACGARSHAPRPHRR
jgi:23S rRNA pseudouridine2605 synthase